LRECGRSTTVGPVISFAVLPNALLEAERVENLHSGGEAAEGDCRLRTDPTIRRLGSNDIATLRNVNAHTEVVPVV